MKTISEQFAETAVEFFNTKLSQLPEDIVPVAKRCLLDTLAVTLGGYGSPVHKVVVDWAREFGGKKESTIIGDGFMVPACNASLVNGTMMRYLDYNDFYGGIEAYIRAGWHPSETIPALLAVGERVHASGAEILKGIIMAYELGNRLLDVAGESTYSIGPKGIHSLGCVVMPAAVGPFLEMNAKQIADAIGTSGGMVTLGIVDAMPEEPNAMAKNTVYPLAAWIGITAALWAKNGFTGPARVFEGPKGLVSSVLGDQYDLDALRRSLMLPWERYSIRETTFKMFPVESSSLAPVEGVSRLIEENNITPDEIEAIHILASERCVAHDGDPHHYYTINKESADHSLPFTVSTMILEREIGPDQYMPEKLSNPKVPVISKKINLRADPTIDNKVGGADVEIRTVSRGTFSISIKNCKGHPSNPLTDEELKEKFLKMASRVMTRQKAHKCIDLIHDLENQPDVHEFMKRFVF
jgi:2-methylcitrate dehydratase